MARIWSARHVCFLKLIAYAVSTFSTTGIQDASPMRTQSVSRETIRPDHISRLSIQTNPFRHTIDAKQIPSLLIWQHKAYILTSVAQCAVSYWTATAETETQEQEPPGGV
jgi:hypothetical protein